MKKYMITLAIMTLSIVLTAQVKKVKHIILIGCDGLGAYAIPDAEMPHLKNLMESGSYSITARAVLPSSSAVNWASMLMGAGPTFHGYTEWGSKVPEIPSIITTKHELFPSIFSVIRQQKPQAKTAAIYSWEGIGYLIEKSAIDFVVPTYDNDDAAVDSAVRIIQEHQPLFTFIHLDEPDHTGHSIGHRTPAYYEALKLVDKRIGKIVAAVSAAGIQDETIIMVTSDHGGLNKGHGGKSLDEVEIPWVITGRGVTVNKVLQDPIITYDTAATLAWILGMKVPQAWRGKEVTEAFKR